MTDVSQREVILAAGLDRYMGELEQLRVWVEARFAAFAKDMSELQEIARDRPGLRVVEGLNKQGSNGHDRP
jgi:hypothetical protein